MDVVGGFSNGRSLEAPSLIPALPFPGPEDRRKVLAGSTAPHKNLEAAAVHSSSLPLQARWESSYRPYRGNPSAALSIMCARWKAPDLPTYLDSTLT